MSDIRKYIELLEKAEKRTIMYHVTKTEKVDAIRDEGIKSPAYVWDTIDMAKWFKDLNSDPSMNDNPLDLAILEVDVSGIQLEPDPEAEDMSDWGSRFKEGEFGGAWISKSPISHDRMLRRIE